MSTLIGKIATASLKVGALATDKTNTQQNYNYISADKVLERAGDALAQAGVVIIPAITSEVTEPVATGNSKSRYDSTVHFAMHISDGETSLEMPWCGRGSDYSVPDKALYKAITSGHKYFLMKLLNIGVGNEDGEHDDGQAAQDTKAPRRPAAAPTEDVSFERQRDNPFEDAPPMSRLTPEQAAIIAHLGKGAYPDDWDDNMDRLALWASGGARGKLGDLYEIEAEKLIKALKKKAQAVAA